MACRRQNCRCDARTLHSEKSPDSAVSSFFLGLRHRLRTKCQHRDPVNSFVQETGPFGARPGTSKASVAEELPPESSTTSDLRGCTWLVPCPSARKRSESWPSLSNYLAPYSSSSDARKAQILARQAFLVAERAQGAPAAVTDTAAIDLVATVVTRVQLALRALAL